MATINSLTSLTTPTANDLLAIWDSNAGSGEEPTKKMSIGDLIATLTTFRIISTTIPSNAQPNQNTVIFSESGLSNYIPIAYAINNSNWTSWFDGNVGSLTISGDNLYIWLTASVLAGKDIKVVLLKQ